MLTKKMMHMLVLIAMSMPAYTQQCDCSSELTYLIKKVESNYPGYLFEVSDKTRGSYETFKSGLHVKARNSTYDDCYFILKTYTGYFKDAHLGVFESPDASPAQVDSLKKNAKLFPISESEAKNYFTAKSKVLDPVEGIWKNSVYTVAIRKAENNKYFGSILSSTNKNWEYGQVKLELVKKGKNNYHAILYNGRHLKTNNDASIWKSVLMNIGPGKWVKVFPETTELDQVNLINPELPTLKILDADNILLSMPSFLIEKSYLDSLIKRYDKELRSAKNLIIDLQANVGGNMVYENLLKYIYTGPMKQYGSKSIANDDNIAYFQSMVDAARKSGGVNKWAEDIIANLEKNKGGIADVIPPDSLVLDSVYAFPKRVAIITDRSNASSAEAFLKYYSKQSKKVIQFGDRTAGVLDYGSVSSVRLGCTNGKYLLYYPIFFENNLPQAGINKTGIVPDVRIPESVKDKITFVREYLKKM